MLRAWQHELTKSHVIGPCLPPALTFFFYFLSLSVSVILSLSLALQLL